MEQELEIVENQGYKNINLKPKPNRGLKGLEYDNYIVVEKVYEEGKELVPKNPKYKPSYVCSVTYKGEQVTFFLTQTEHKMFKQAGGIGDKVKMTLKKQTSTNPQTGMELSYPQVVSEAFQE